MHMRAWHVAWFALWLPCAVWAQDLPAGEGPPIETETEVPAAPTMVPAPPVERPAVFNVVRLRGLDKVTARSHEIEAPLGTVARFGALEIIAKRCWRAPPEARPEDAAWLEVRELKPSQGPETVFTGWMFASSPSLVSLSHPVYDIAVLGCDYRENPEEAEAMRPSPPPAEAR